MVDDAKRRASDALIEAMREGITLLQVVELAMDDIDVEDGIAHQLSSDHEALTNHRRYYG